MEQSSFIEKQIKSPRNQQIHPSKIRTKVVLNCHCHIYGVNLPKIIFSTSFSCKDYEFNAILKF